MPLVSLTTRVASFAMPLVSFTTRVASFAMRLVSFTTRVASFAMPLVSLGTRDPRPLPGGLRVPFISVPRTYSPGEMGCLVKLGDTLA
jgi:hypothetical protein